MAGVGGAIAEGIQGGWNMGLQSDQLQLQKQQQQEASARADQALELQQQQFGLQAQQVGLAQTQARMKALQDRQSQLVDIATRARAAGLPTPGGLADEYGANDQQLSDLRAQFIGAPPPAPAAGDTGTPTSAAPGAPGTQPAAGPVAPTSSPNGQPAVAAPAAVATTPQQREQADVEQRAQDIASKLQTGQLQLNEVAPKDLAMMFTVALKRPPSDIKVVQQGLADWQAGMATGNSGLTIQGLNTVYGPQLQRGVGDPSPYGGHIVSKQIIGLDPAQSADGSVHTDKVIPRLRITTDVKGPDGQPLTYDAPMTLNRSADPNDPVRAISVQDAATNLGQIGALVTAMQHPDIAAAVAKGQKAAQPQIDSYLSQLNALSAPQNPALMKEVQFQNYGKAMGLDPNDPTQRTQITSRLQDLGVLPRPPRMPSPLAEHQAAEDMVARGEAKTVAQAYQIMHPHAGSPTINLGMPATTDATGAPLTPEAFLSKLSPQDRQTVQTVARDPSTLNSVSIAKGRREQVMDWTSQYLKLLHAQDSVQLGQGAPGIDENGKSVGGVDPATARFYALQSIMGNDGWQVGLGRGKTGQRLIAAVKDKIPALAKELGLAPEDIGTNKASYKALSATLQDRTKYVTAVNQLQGTLTKQADLVKSLLAKGGATEGGPLFNAPYNKIREALGSTDAHNLDVALTGLAREHQRVIVSPLSNAQLAVQAQHTGDNLANLNLTPSQILGTIDVMEQEAQNARDQGEATLSGLRDQIGGLGKSRTPAPAPATGLGLSKPAGPTVGTVQQGYRFKGGDPSQQANWEKVQ